MTTSTVYECTKHEMYVSCHFLCKTCCLFYSFVIQPDLKTTRVVFKLHNPPFHGIQFGEMKTSNPWAWHVFLISNKFHGNMRGCYMAFSGWVSIIMYIYQWIYACNSNGCFMIKKLTRCAQSICKNFGECIEYIQPVILYKFNRKQADGFDATNAWTGIEKSSLCPHDAGSLASMWRRALIHFLCQIYLYWV